jgi:signal transduction histidine kinase/ligand-binding sensor domain-containing protein
VWRGQNRGFEPLGEQHELTQRAHALAEQPEGILWVGTDRGVRAFDVDTLEQRPVPAPLDGIQVRTLVADDDGGVLAGSARGLYRWVPAQGSAETVSLYPGTEELEIFSIARGPTGDVWIGANSALMHIGADGRQTQPCPGLVGPGTVALLLTRDGALWIGLRREPGLYRLLNDKLQRWTRVHGLLNDEVNALCEDPSGSVWVATEDGVFVFSEDRFTSVSREKGLRNTDVHSILVDREELVWIGTFGSGAVQLRSLAIESYHVEDGLPHPLVMGLALAADGGVLIATPDGVCHLPRGGQTLDRLSPFNARYVSADRQGRVWQDDSSGLRRLDRELAVVTSVGLQALAQGPGEGVLFGTPDGLFAVEDDTAARVELPAEIGPDVRAIAADPHGGWLIGTARGLARWTDSGWIVLQRDVEVSVAGRDAGGMVWIGTGNTLLRLEGELQEVPGPGKNVGAILDLAFQSDGTVWAASRKGLLRYRDGVLQRFSTADGLPSLDVRSLLLDPGGRYLFAGTSEGVAQIDTWRFRPPVASAPRVAIRYWRAGEAVGSSHGAGLQLPYADQELLVTLDCLGWRTAEGVRFERRLDGRDSEWSAPNAEPRFRLGRLPPGHYTLRVRGVSLHGVRSDREATLALTVLPPWWRQPWVMILAAVLVASAVLLTAGYLFKKRLLQAERRRQAAREAQLKDQLQHSKRMAAVGTLAAGVAHDMNNLLTAVLGYRDMAAGSRSSATLQEALDGIATVASQGTHLVQSLLTFSRQKAQPAVKIDLRTLIQDTARMLKPILPAAVKLDVDVDGGDAVWISADPTRASQVLVNLAVNARDAMPRGGALRFTVRRLQSAAAGDWPDAVRGEAGLAVCCVEDTGVGMTADVREQIFDPFFTTKTRGSGTGLGLAVVHGIIKDLEGTIRVDSEPGSGTRITFALPCCHAPERSKEPQHHTDHTIRT